MKIIMVLFIVLASANMSVAYAKDADDPANALLNQFKSCIDYDPDSAIGDSLTAAMHKTAECLKSSHEEFLRRHPGSPAGWHIGSTSAHLKGTHTATDVEGKHLKMIMNGENVCRKILLNYSGPRDSFITEIININKKGWEDERSILMDYMKGKIDLSQLAVRTNQSNNIRKASYDTAWDEHINTSKTRREEHNRYCNAQLQANKQRVLQEIDHRETMRAIAQQQKEIQQLKQRTDDAELRAYGAEMDADAAKAEAARNQQNTQ
jgi:hypothetical protein